MMNLENLRYEDQEKLRYITIQSIKKMQEKSKMHKYQERPDLWLLERFREDPRTIKWSEFNPMLYKNHEWDGDIDPLFSAWMSVANFQDTALLSATSTGKTYWLARVVYWFLDVFPNPLVVTTAPKESQLSEHLWSEMSRVWEKYQLIRPNAVRGSLRIRKDVKHPKYFQSAEAIGFVAGVGANEESATKAQGFHREYMLIITEETPGISTAIMKAFENTSTGSKNVRLAVGNPDSKLDPLCRFADEPDTRKIIASAYDHPNVIIGKEVIPGAVSVKSIEKRKNKYGEESSFFKSRVRGIAPEEGKDSLLQLAWLKVVSHKDFEPKQNVISYNAVGVDVANSESGDMAATAWGRGNVLEELHEFQCPDANQLAYNLVMDDYELQEEFQGKRYVNHHLPTLRQYDIHDGALVGVDAVGVGAGTINALRHLGVEAVSLQGKQLTAGLELDNEGKPLYEFNSLRSQMFWEFREDVRQGYVKLNITPKMFKALCDELLAHRFEVKSGKIAITKKDDVKKALLGKSPNLADCIVYWNHIRKGYYFSQGYSPVYSEE